MKRARPCCSRLPRAGVSALMGLLATTAGAQQPPRVPAEREAPPVIVTANPTGSVLTDLASPADVLSGSELRDRLETTLGDTLSSQTGVSASGFGPNASRPVVRGLDGERVRILQNGASLLDASGASPDHAVAIEPLTLDRIEVVRGPAALMYGGSAIGGVVNAIDGRIAEFPPDRPFSGTVQLRAGGAAGERGFATRLDGGHQGLALHVDAYQRETSDLRIPGLARSDRIRAAQPLPADQEVRGHLPNSAAMARGAGAGVTLFGESHRLGLSVGGLSSDYGTVADPAVTIGMRQTRYDLAADVRDLGLVDIAKFRLGYTDYRHTEFESGEPGTRFGNRGYDARLDLRHRRFGLLDGSLGFQAQDSRFQALGAEAFIPPVRTRSLGVFLFEEAVFGDLRLTGGARVDRVQLAASEVLPNFTPARERAYNPRSASLGAVLALGGGYALATNLSWNERAPNYAEVFANGPHAATGLFEVGRDDQGLERATAFDLGLRRREGRVTGQLGVFQHSFGNFIAMRPTGLVDTDSGLAIVRFEGVRARLRGIEADARLHLVEGREDAMHLDLRADLVRADDLSNGAPLPRISPLRFTVALAGERSGSGYRIEAIRASSQPRVAPGELPTDGYVLLNARLHHLLLQAGDRRLELFLRATNLLDQEVRLHTSQLKDIAPLAGRGVMLGLTGQF